MELKREKSDRPLWLILLPCHFLLLFALLPADLLEPFLRHATRNVSALSSIGAAAVIPPHALSATAFVAPTLAVAVALVSPLHTRPVCRIARRVAWIAMLSFRGIDIIRSGFVSDYVVWMALGLGLIAAVFYPS
jgi:hypothetical protein